MLPWRHLCRTVNAHANLKKQSFDLTFSCMPVNPEVYRHPGKSRHIPACSKMRGNTVPTSPARPSPAVFGLIYRQLVLMRRAGHSFRIGAATTAAAAGLPSWLIQTLGRWSSDCYRRYIHMASNTLCKVAAQLASTSAHGVPVWRPTS